MNNRRKLLVAGLCMLAPDFGRAQGTKRRLVGVIRINRRNTNEAFVEPIRREMAVLGWKEKENVEFLFSWADGRNDRLSELAADLVARGVDVIVTFGDPGVRAAQKATTTIPIVGMSDDMVGGGLVQSLARPGGNTTGISILASDLDAKRLQVLHEAVPRARRIGVLHDPSTGNSMPSVAAAGLTLGLELVARAAQTGAEIDSAISALIKARVDAVNVLASPILNGFRTEQIARFSRARLPAIFQWPESAEDGGLIAYGPRLSACYRQVARLVDRVLRGVRPADLPIEQPTLFELVVNMKTAKALGIKIPQSILVRADKVIA